MCVCVCVCVCVSGGGGGGGGGGLHGPSHRCYCGNSNCTGFLFSRIKKRVCSTSCCCKDLKPPSHRDTCICLRGCPYLTFVCMCVRCIPFYACILLHVYVCTAVFNDQGHSLNTTDRQKQEKNDVHLVARLLACTPAPSVPFG